MKVIIIGCGRMGSGLAIKLSRNGNDVTVIDADSKAFEHLGEKFKGKTIVGIGFDKDVLEEAKASIADAVISCTSSDETNALIGRITRNIYKVPRVISRLYDPRKAEIYRTLGIQTISTTTWGIQRATELISYDRLDSVLTIGNSEVDIVRIEVPALLAGRTVSELTVYGEIHVVAITRNNKSFLPISGTVFQPNDVIFISSLSSSVNKLKKLLGLN
jgi:trk system potassium uptake protein